MSNIRYPIVHCPPGPARDRLIDALKALGFGTAGWSIEQLKTHPRHDYPCLIKQDGQVHIGLGSSILPEHLKWFSQSMTVVNSPNHFLSYVRRVGIRPNQ